MEVTYMLELSNDSVKNRRNINTSIMYDSEIIIIALVANFLVIDLENVWDGHCKKNLKGCLPGLPKLRLFKL